MLLVRRLVSTGRTTLIKQATNHSVNEGDANASAFESSSLDDSSIMTL